MRRTLSGSAKLVAFGACLLAPKAAFADSDGYYCVGPDYLAYQFGLAAPPVAPHYVYVVHLGRSGVMAEPMKLELPQFQVHGMICDAGAVRIAAFDGIYTVRLEVSGRPVRYTKEDRARGTVPMEMVRAQRNLAALGYLFEYKDWGKTIRRSLHSVHHSEFVLEFVPDPVKPEECSTNVTTTLLELDANGRTIGSRRIFRGPAHRACGE